MSGRRQRWGKKERWEKRNYRHAGFITGVGPPFSLLLKLLAMRYPPSLRFWLGFSLRLDFSTSLDVFLCLPCVLFTHSSTYDDLYSPTLDPWDFLIHSVR